MSSRMRVQAVLLSAAIAVVAGCGSSGGSPTSSLSATSGSASAATSSSSPSASISPAVAGCDVAPWRAAPITVTHQVAVPPEPVITSVRVAQHPECGYDRVVLGIHGPIPGYSVRYVDHVIADASGKTIAMPGSSFLLIVVQPAQAHTDVGLGTVRSGVRKPGYPALASWALAGDFEGHVSIALGLSGHVSIRTGDAAGRIYIDLRE
jgi:hypothetical protein